MFSVFLFVVYLTILLFFTGQLDRPLRSADASVSAAIATPSAAGAQQPVTYATVAAAPVAVACINLPAPSYTRQQLQQMTTRQLHPIASGLKVKRYKSLRKAALIDAIAAAQSRVHTLTIS